MNNLIEFSCQNKPDRPINKYLIPVRKFIRHTRLLFHRVRLGSKISIGQNVFFGRSCYLMPPNYLKLGNNVAVGLGFYLESNLDVGNDVLISSFVSMVGNDHCFDNPDSSVYNAGRLPPSRVVIEGDNLIGHKVIIVGDVRIGRGCIVGAGAVVTKDLPRYTVCYGVPAKPMKKRFAL